MKKIFLTLLSTVCFLNVSMVHASSLFDREEEEGGAISGDFSNSSTSSLSLDSILERHKEKLAEREELTRRAQSLVEKLNEIEYKIYKKRQEKIREYRKAIIFQIINIEKEKTILEERPTAKDPEIAKLYQKKGKIDVLQDKLKDKTAKTQSIPEVQDIIKSLKNYEEESNELFEKLESLQLGECSVLEKLNNEPEMKELSEEAEELKEMLKAVEEKEGRYAIEAQNLANQLKDILQKKMNKEQDALKHIMEVKEGIDLEMKKRIEAAASLLIELEKKDLEITQLYKAKEDAIGQKEKAIAIGDKETEKAMGNKEKAMEENLKKKLEHKTPQIKDEIEDMIKDIGGYKAEYTELYQEWYRYDVEELKILEELNNEPEMKGFSEEAEGLKEVLKEVKEEEERYAIEAQNLMEKLNEIKKEIYKKKQETQETIENIEQYQEVIISQIIEIKKEKANLEKKLEEEINAKDPEIAKLYQKKGKIDVLQDKLKDKTAKTQSIPEVQDIIKSLKNYEKESNELFEKLESLQLGECSVLEELNNEPEMKELSEEAEELKEVLKAVEEEEERYAIEASQLERLWWKERGEPSFVSLLCCPPYIEDLTHNVVNESSLKDLPKETIKLTKLKKIIKKLEEPVFTNIAESGLYPWKHELLERVIDMLVYLTRLTNQSENGASSAGEQPVSLTEEEWKNIQNQISQIGEALQEVENGLQLTRMFYLNENEENFARETKKEMISMIQTIKKSKIVNILNLSNIFESEIWKKL